MKIFILGAGYVGQAIIRQWRGNDLFWASTTRESNLPALQSQVERAFVLKGSDRNALRPIIAECGGMIVCTAPLNKDYEDTYYATAQAISDILIERTSPFYLLYTGSTSVYGDHNGEWVDEQSGRKAASDAGRILKKTEEIYLSCNAQVCVLRLGGIYGPSRELESRARKMSGKMIPGDPQQPTNHIHLEDIAEAAEFCFQEELTGVYNLVNNDHPTRNALYTSLCETLQIPPPIWDAAGISTHGSNCKVSNKKILERGIAGFRDLSACNLPHITP